MAGAYKPKGAKKWVSWWTGVDGRRHRKAAFADKALALKLANDREAECRQQREGLLPPGEVQRREAARVPPAKHVEDYRLHLLAKGGTAAHARHVAGALTRLLAEAGVASLAGIAAAKVQGALGRMKAAGKSARTCNHALGAVKAWCAWLAEDDRIKEVPRGLKSLRPFNEEADRRKVRRALTKEELARLLAAAEAGPDAHVYGPTKSKHQRIPIPGPDRAALYRLAMGTGFRANELRSLTPESFRLDGPAPAVVVEAAYSKNGRRAEQPITRELAAAIRPFVEGRPPGEPVLVVPEKTAEMLRRDLAAAGVPYRTDAGVVDFHALRHSYITHLIASGVDPKTVQVLARHSTVMLTIDRYTKTDDERKRKALERGQPG